jgi:hypothetical protein
VYQAQMTAGLYAGGTVVFALKTLGSLPEPARKVALLAGTTTALPCPPAFVPGYTFLAGTGLLGVVTDWTYASEARLVGALQTFNQYEATKISSDVYCSLAGDRTYTGNLGSFNKPVYIIRTGHGMGPYMTDNINLLGTASGDITTNLQSGFGHGDHYAAASHLTYLEAPVKAWLDTLFP